MDKQDHIGQYFFVEQSFDIFVMHLTPILIYIIYKTNKFK